MPLAAGHEVHAVRVECEGQVQLPERAAEVPGSSVAKIRVEEIAAQRPHVLDEAPGFLNVRTLTVTQLAIRGVGRRGLEEERSQRGHRSKVSDSARVPEHRSMDSRRCATGMFQVPS